MTYRNLNFLEKPRNVQTLQLLTLAAVLGSVVMTSALVFRGAPGTATIADTLASASFSNLPAPSAPAKPKAISEHGVVSAASGTASDTVRFYEEGSGKAFEVTLTTQRTDVLSDRRLPGFLWSYWIPRTRSVISAFQQPTGVEHRFFNYENGESVLLGFGISNIAVSPDGRRIAQLKKNSDDSYSLSVSAVDGTGPLPLLTTRIQEPKISWRSSDELALISKRSDRPGYDLTLIDAGGALRPLLSNKEGLEALWSSDGDLLLYSFFSADTGISLWLRSLQTGKEVALGVYTSAHKCAWHPVGRVVTCGIPMKKSLTRDVSSSQTATIDDIYTYDFDENTLRLNYSGTSSSLIGITNPLISSSGAYFVFTNMFDSRLYALPF